VHSARPPLPLVVCSLDAEGQRARLGEWAALLAAASTRVPTADGARYSFSASDELERQIRALAAAEKACCSFLDFDISRRARTIELTVTSPPDGLDALRLVFPT
jgi:hypothetical protein